MRILRHLVVAVLTVAVFAAGFGFLHLLRNYVLEPIALASVAYAGPAGGFGMAGVILVIAYLVGRRWPTLGE